MHIGLTSVGAQGVTRGQGFSLHMDEQRGREEPSGGGTGGQEELHVVHVNLAEHVEESVCINKCLHASRASPPDV